LEKLDILVKNWDKQIPQVLIEAKIMQVTLDKNRFLGVDWAVSESGKTFHKYRRAEFTDTYRSGLRGCF